MKRYFALALVISLAALTAGRSQGLDDQYVEVFNKIQEADTLSGTQPAKALAKYVEAQTVLQRIQKGSPDWNPKIVSFRLSYIASKIAALSTNEPAAPGASTTQTNPPASVSVTNAPAVPAQPVVPSALELQLNTLKDQVRQLQADRVVMEAKLKEALAAQPAEADPQELAKAQERIKALQKENELLKAAFESEKAKTPAVDAKASEATQKALVEANLQLAEQKELASKMTVERDALQARLKALAAGPDLTALKAENQLLKQKLSAAESSAAKPAEKQQKTTELQAQIAALQSDKELLRLEKVALENRIRQLSGSGTGAVAQPAAAEPASRIQQLERERDDLQKKLQAATKSSSKTKGKAQATQMRQLEYDLAAAHARLDVLEARQVPYSAEELALMKTPETKLSSSSAPPAKKSSKEMPAGSTKLVAEAQSSFASHQFDKAEAAYQEVLKLDNKSVPALANLAAIQIEEGRMEDADKSIKAALAEDPDDAFSLYILGILRFRQSKYDESLDALSRAAKLDPDNAEIQNHLGLVLAQKGMRTAAETALRKAIQLQPNYGGAHYNLACVYLSQQPPATELAKWHYRKALAAGYPQNADLEKKFEGK